MKAMTIGQVAKLAGIGIETIRFYERKGLLETPKRTDSGYRIFDANTVSRLQFIQNGKQLGFTLSEIRELLSLEVRPGTTRKEIKAVAQEKLVEVKEKLKLLRQIERSLKSLVSQCDGTGSISQCPILDSIKGR